MSDRANTPAEHWVSFGPFRLLPAQRILLEGEVPVRLGSRALDILIALVESPGELVSKNDLIARAWPDTFVDEGSLRVHVASLRRALGDGQPGRRFLANVPGRGYQFVAPLQISQPEQPASESKAPPAGANNLPLAQTRAVGRDGTIRALAEQLPKRRFLTLVGAGGIGKTTVAVAVAERLLPAYEHGVWFVDLAPLGEEPHLVPSAVARVLGVAVPAGDPASRLVEHLGNRRLLILLDNCEHVVDIAAPLAERILAGAPDVDILATSREPLRADGEHLHRLAPLECPPESDRTTAARALAYPAIQLFVERGMAILDSFELSDADAPIVAEICTKLGGIALAIELAAARLDAFGLKQLLELLGDRFHILNRGRRTADPRHRSLAATLDWSYEFLPEGERAVFRRLSVFAGTFALEDATAVAQDVDSDVLEAIGNLVAKSLIVADVGGWVVRYRLLQPTRAYAMQKLIEAQEHRRYAQRHALHYRGLMERAEAEWARRPAAEWREDYSRTLDDVSCALNWAFSADGDPAIGVALATAAIPLWTDLSLMDENYRRSEQAWSAGLANPLQESKLLAAMAIVAHHTKGALPGIDALWTRALQITEDLGDSGQQGRTLAGFTVYRALAGDHRGTLALTEKMRRLADTGDIGTFGILADSMSGSALFHMADYAQARRRLATALAQPLATAHSMQLALRIPARIALASLLFVQGFPEQAVEAAHAAVDDARTVDNGLLLCSALAQASCPIALQTGDWDSAEAQIAILLDLSRQHGLPLSHAQGQCWKGILVVSRNGTGGLDVMQEGLRRLREANFRPRFPIVLGCLADALAEAGRITDARFAIEEAIAISEESKELWSLPELLRIRGKIACLEGAGSEDSAANKWFVRSLEMAREHSALSWELRAATSLARLRHQNGEARRERERLSDIYARFTEGFDTTDLRSARRLIDQYGEVPG